MPRESANAATRRRWSVQAGRVVEVEALDHLAVDDPAAVRSRADLLRIHRAMGSRRLLLRALNGVAPGPDRPVLRVLELGAGDGRLMLGVAQSLRARWGAVQLQLLDRLPLLSERTVGAFAAAGWTATALQADVFDWAVKACAPRIPAAQGPAWDLIVANLFLHHFADEALRRLLDAIACSARAFIALEPRRAPLALAASHCVGLIGANAVTRQDAVLSVRAGFRAREISALWPAAGGWQLREGAMGLFSHGFIARAQSAGCTAT